MDTFKEGLLVSGVRGYQSAADATTFYYIPGPVKPERGPNGEATLTLMRHNAGGSLQCAVRWEITDAEMDALRRELARRFALPDAASLRLLPAPVTVQGVILEQIEPGGTAVAWARFSTSGFPPYTSLISHKLDRDRAAIAERAVRGETGLLHVAYDVTLAYEVFVAVRIEGAAAAEISELAAELRGTSNTLAEETIHPHCVELLERLLASGRAREEVIHSDPSLLPAGLEDKTAQEARQKAISALKRSVRFALGQSDAEPAPLTSAEFHGEARQTATVPFALHPETDIGEWFASGQADKHILLVEGAVSDTLTELISSPLPSVTAGPRTLRLGFTMPQETPVAFVEIVRGSDTVRLIPPRYDPVTLPAASGNDSTATIRTHYTDGTPPFETPLGIEDALPPGQLGIAVVTVDATARKTAGVKRLEMTVRYLPDPARPDVTAERSLNLRFGDWTDSWAFVTGDSNGKGVLEYTCTETDRDDTRTDQEVVRTPAFDIRL